MSSHCHAATWSPRWVTGSARSHRNARRVRQRRRKHAFGTKHALEGSPLAMTWAVRLGARQNMKN